MIRINDIVKFSDYKDIYLESKDCFVYQTQSKKYNIKGTNVEKYISPIFYKMFQPNFVSDLLEYVKDKFKNEEDVEIVGDDLAVTAGLYGGGHDAAIAGHVAREHAAAYLREIEIGRASCMERV